MKFIIVACLLVVIACAVMGSPAASESQTDDLETAQQFFGGGYGRRFGGYGGYGRGYGRGFGGGYGGYGGGFGGGYGGYGGYGR